jgi:hypothetical protein
VGSFLCAIFSSVKANKVVMVTLVCNNACLCIFVCVCFVRVCLHVRACVSMCLSVSVFVSVHACACGLSFCWEITCVCGPLGGHAVKLAACHESAVAQARVHLDAQLQIHNRNLK